MPAYIFSFHNTCYMCTSFSLFSMYGVNKHYGTPRNPCVPDRVPGGSSSGSAVAVAAKLVDFSLGTDTGASVRVPASYCGILGFRPSLGAVSTVGVLPMSQSYDTVVSHLGWFARDPMILNRIGRVLLHLPDVDPIKPSQIIIAEDCFRLSIIPSDRTAQVLVKSIENLFGAQCVKHVILGDYVKGKVPSLQHFMDKGNEDQKDDIPSLAALSSAMRLLQRYEFKNYHAKWVTKVNPDFGPGISERIWDAIKATGENIDFCHSVRTELRAALTALLGVTSITFIVKDHGILALPTTPGEPPEVQANPATSDIFFSRPFSLLSVAGSSGFCQRTKSTEFMRNITLEIIRTKTKNHDS
ncbi:amidase 1-like isoform X2 [Gossypium australe]|uniref:Amidase 1-like isoform X2 n=1 Tax=Gossypium australe TaxID=47621 RepID=A0A5B6VUR1_9ROSI|nr:amidase 1-like isoform X2 [Gossypium australe]